MVSPLILMAPPVLIMMASSNLLLLVSVTGFILSVPDFTTISSTYSAYNGCDTIKIHFPTGTFLSSKLPSALVLEKVSKLESDADKTITTALEIGICPEASIILPV